MKFYILFSLWSFTIAQFWNVVDCWHHKFKIYNKSYIYSDMEITFLSVESIISKLQNLLSDMLWRLFDCFQFFLLEIQFFPP